MYTYNWYQWLAFFYFYCFFGWVFESTYVSLKKRHFVNRGFLRIPMLPLYGFGAVMMLWVSLPFRDNLFLVYLSGMIAATALEYVTGSVMEQLFKIRYWDYSNQPFQIKGYICLSSSVAWGFLTILMTEVIQTPVADVVLSLPPAALILTVAFISVVFVTDVYESTKNALALGKSLEAMTKVKAEIEDLQARVSALKEEAAEQVQAAKEGTAERLTLARLQTKARLTSVKWETAEKLAIAREDAHDRLVYATEGTAEKMSAAREEAVKRLSAVARRRNTEQFRLMQQLDEAKKKWNALLPSTGLGRFYHRSLLKGNPGAVSSRFGAALKELRDQLNKTNH